MKISLQAAAFAAAFSSLSLSGCTVDADKCDPSGDPSMLEKFSCTVTGSYDKRLEDKKEQIRLKSMTLQNLTEQQRILENERVMVQGKLAEKNKALDGLESSLEELRAELDRNKNASAELKQKLDNVESAINAVKNGSDDEAVLKKQVEYDKLKNEYNDLMNALM